ncbi:MAG TPA: hypothetical protein DDY43_12650 [Synechococcales bacterium UBA10510]|nr:hypothetical protein [Synechococcales bacterium UBA10510]
MQCEPFLCWTSCQKGEHANSAQQLANLHRERCPGALVDVVDSSTPELAAELAADPDGWAERRVAEAKRLGVGWAIYCTPAISSGLSWARWRPAAVIAFAGGRVGPEHVAQALARVRCPEVPAYLYAPERCPGAALRVGSGATSPAELVRDLRSVADPPLYGELTGGDAEGAWLSAWAELGAQRNRQRFAYRASITGLLEREGWELQAPGPEPCPVAGAQAAADLKAAALAHSAAADAAVIDARPLTEQEATDLAKQRHLEPLDQAALKRHRLAAAWGLEGSPPTQSVIDADRDGLRDRLRLGWLLATPEAIALVGAHDQALQALRQQLEPRLAELEQRLASRDTELREARETAEMSLLQLHQQVQEERERHSMAEGEKQRQLEAGVRDLEQLRRSKAAQESNHEQSKAAQERAHAQARAELEQGLASRDTQLREAREEAEMTFQQLHQAQEELEHYFLKARAGDQLAQAQMEQLQRAQSLLVRLNPDVLPSAPYPPALAVEVLPELPAAMPDPSLQTQALLSTYAASLQRASALLERARRY